MKYVGSLIEPCETGWRGLVYHSLFTAGVGGQDVKIIISNLHSCVCISASTNNGQNHMVGWVVGSTKDTVSAAVELIIAAAIAADSAESFSEWFKAQPPPATNKKEEFITECKESISELLLLMSGPDYDTDAAADLHTALTHVTPSIAGMLFICKEGSSHATYNALCYMEPSGHMPSQTSE